jgi:hypothetical protein
MVAAKYARVRQLVREDRCGMLSTQPLQLGHWPTLPRERFEVTQVSSATPSRPQTTWARSDGDHRRQLVLGIVNRFDSSSGDWPGWLYPIGPELAADLLDDGLAAAKPPAAARWEWLKRGLLRPKLVCPPHRTLVSLLG